jgi:hypothetical protein
MSDSLCQHSVNALSESTYVCGQCGKTIRRNETCIDDDVTLTTISTIQSSITPHDHIPNAEANALSSQAYTTGYTKNSDDDETRTDSSEIALLPLSPGQGQLSPAQNAVPTAQGTPQIADVPYAQGAPHVQKMNSPKHSSPPTYTQRTADNQGVQRTGEPGQPSQGDVQQALPPSSHPVAAHNVKNLPLSGGGGIRYLFRHIIPLQGFAGVSILVFVVIIAVLVSSALFLYAPPKHKVVTGGSHTQATPPPSMPQLLAKGSQVPGATITIQGSNFKPKGTITLIVDNAPSIVAPNKKTVGPHTSSFALAFTGIKRGSVDPTTIVRDDGTFVKDFVIPRSWLPKSHHTILASEEDNGTNTLATANLDLAIQGTRPHSTVLHPCVQVNETTLSFSGRQGHEDPADQPLSLKNCGREGAWTAKVEKSDEADWLHVDVTKGSLKAQETQQFSVATAITGLQPGIYHGTINFTLASAQTQVHVTLFVTSPDICVQTTPATLTLSNKQPQGTPFTIKNCGNAGSWLAIVKTDDDANWLSVDTTNGSLNAGAFQNIMARANTANLREGTYTGSIYILLGATVNAQGNPIMAMSQIKVTLQLLSNIQPATQQLSFSGTQLQSDPSPQSIVLTNTGYTGQWAATVETANGGNWLSIDKHEGTLASGATQNVVATVGVANLQVGTYKGAVIFTLGNSTQVVPIIFVITSSNNYDGTGLK